MWLTCVARARPSYRTTCSRSRCGSPSGNRPRHAIQRLVEVDTKCECLQAFRPSHPLQRLVETWPECECLQDCRPRHPLQRLVEVATKCECRLAGHHVFPQPLWKPFREHLREDRRGPSKCKEKQELGRIWELGRILHRENEELRK